MLEQQIPAIHKGGSVIEHRERKCRVAFGVLIIGIWKHAFSKKYDKNSVLI